MDGSLSWRVGRLVAYWKSSGLVAAVWCALGAQQALASNDEDDDDDVEYTTSGSPDWLSPRVVPGQEVYGGADVGLHAWSIYSGTTVAPFGDIRFNGPRLRSAATYGAYRYASRRWDGARRHTVPFEGQQATADILLGWQQAFGPWIVKIFAGGTLEDHMILPVDVENAVRGERLGFKVALETWLSLGDWAFVQTETAWSQPFGAHNARFRAGYRLHPAWSVGVEGAIIGNINYDAGRMGTFVRVESNLGELSISGGVSGDRDAGIGGYGTIGLLWRF